MTADTPAATATADPSAAPAQTTADTTTTDTTTAEGSQVTPQKGDASKEPQSTEADKATETAAPETYTFTMPEGMEIDQGLLEKFTPLLKESKIPQEQAQKFADMLAGHFKSLEAGAGEAFDKAYAERREAETAQQSEEWRQAVSNDKELSSPEVNARVIAAVGAVGTPEMKQALNDLGWGNHPELVRLVHRLIDYVPPEKGERAAGGGGALQSDYDRMYSQAEKPTKPLPKTA